MKSCSYLVQSNRHVVESDLQVVTIYVTVENDYSFDGFDNRSASHKLLMGLETLVLV